MVACDGAGRELAAALDRTARWLFPLGFAIFLILEFCGCVLG